MNNIITPALASANFTQRRPYAAPAFVQELALETRAGSPLPHFNDGSHEDIIDPILGLPPTPMP